ncbi:MAG: hypothetical protein ACRDHD_03360 [Candidatus Limnocylindria bacterium]
MERPDRDSPTPAEACRECGRDVSIGTPLFARRVQLISEADPGVAFVCLDCRVTNPLRDEAGNVLDEEQLAARMYIVGRGGQA